FIKLWLSLLYMKHPFSVTFIIIVLFIVAQLIGLHVLSQYVDIEQSAQSGQVVIEQGKYLIEPPPIENRSYSFIFITLAVLIGTLLVLLLAKYQLFSIWKVWFFLSVV